MRFNKMFAILASIVMLLFISGCSKEKEVDSNNEFQPVTRVVSINTVITDQPSSQANSLLALETGNLVKQIGNPVIKDGRKWIPVEAVCFSYPPVRGWIESQTSISDINSIVPNQGFLNKKNVYSQPDLNSTIIYDNCRFPIQILKRENGWAYGAFPSGWEGWVQEIDISYDFLPTEE